MMNYSGYNADKYFVIQLSTMKTWENINDCRKELGSGKFRKGWKSNDILLCRGAGSKVKEENAPENR